VYTSLLLLLVAADAPSHPDLLGGDITVRQDI
jgi:hypothetical protein